MSNKIRSKSTNSVFLTGGLGNQIFQLAAGLNFAIAEDLILETSNWKSHFSGTDIPEISDYILPANVSFGRNSHMFLLKRKLINLIIRSGALIEDGNKWNSFWKTSKSFASYILRLCYFRQFNIISPNGVGFDDSLRLDTRNCILIGYFQSNLWLSENSLLRYLKNLKLKDITVQIEELRKLSIIEKPLILHVRLGDYRVERKVGIPSSNYYENSVTELWSTGKYNKIWIFTDDQNSASNIIPAWIVKNGRWINIDNGRASSNLEAMRLGHGYVISNSTFSWWGAFLSYKKNPTVIAPQPWFRSKTEPNSIVPKGWIRRNAWNSINFEA